MTDEERRIITEFVTRVGGGAPTQPQRGPWGASVPAAAPNLPPVDPEADRLIADLFARNPEARYRLTQTAFVQEAALVQAQNRIQELEWQLEQAQAQAHQAAQARPSGGFLGGLFGGGSQQPQRPMMPTRPMPQPMQPPGGYDPRMLQQGRGGMGFMGTALTTAAGVAGGLVLGNMLMGMMAGGAAEAATAAAGDATAGAFGEEAVATPSSYEDATAGGGGAYAPADDATGGGFEDAGYADDASGGGFDEEF